MKTHLSSLSLVVLSVTASTALQGQDVKLAFVSEGVMPKMGGYVPQKAPTSSAQPGSITKAPPGLTSPEFGEIKMGPASQPRTYAFIIDNPDSETPRLFVDSNANGDLTDDPPATWATNKNKGRDGTTYTPQNGGFTVDLRDGETILKAHLAAYRFDSKEEKRPHNCLLYYSDYGRIGTVTLGDKAFPALLADDLCKGDFAAPGSSLRLDLNGDGKFDFQGESFRVNAPFNIGGTTYELSGLTPGGGSFQIVKSSRTVAESKPAAVLQEGKPAPVFDATTLDGGKVSMPGSFKGKVVLLDFWATWCGPCMAELPNVVATYDKYHAEGLEILGVSLDNADMKDKLPAFLKSKKMTWQQVCDGQGWQAAIGALYSIHSIPATFLIDGDSGNVLAIGARGPALGTAVAKALADKKH